MRSFTPRPRDLGDGARRAVPRRSCARWRTPTARSAASSPSRSGRSARSAPQTVDNVDAPDRRAAVTADGLPRRRPRTAARRRARDGAGARAVVARDVSGPDGGCRARRSGVRARARALLDGGAHGPAVRAEPRGGRRAGRAAGRGRDVGSASGARSQGSPALRALRAGAGARIRGGLGAAGRRARSAPSPRCCGSPIRTRARRPSTVREGFEPDGGESDPTTGCARSGWCRAPYARSDRSRTTTISSRDDLDAGAALRLAERDLVLVEAVPAVEVGVRDAALREQADDGCLVGLRRGPPVGLVVRPGARWSPSRRTWCGR